MSGRVLIAIWGLVLALSGANEAIADAPRYPDTTQRSQIRSATLFLGPDGAFANLDRAEWCAEAQQFLRERGIREARQRHRPALSEVEVDVGSTDPRTAAGTALKVLGSAPAPLSRFRARLEVRHYSGALRVSVFAQEKWHLRRMLGPDPLPFTRDLAAGRWLISAGPGPGRTTRLAVWDQVGEANPYEVQALVALPDGSVHRSRVVPWFPAGVEVNLPGDFPTLRGRPLVAGTYRVIFEADGKTVDWPRSLRFEHWGDE